MVDRRPWQRIVHAASDPFPHSFQMPKVSFILPAYKRRFLEQAIASILAQTYRDFELVVVDDASPENLKEVIDGIHDDRLSYHRNQENIGGKDLAAAWNHALEFATGEWGVLASDDDIYHPEYLQEMIALSEKYPAMDVFHCRSGNIDADGKMIGYGDSHAEYESCIEYLYFRGVKRYYQIAPDFMFRIRTLRKIGGFISFPVGFFSDDATWFALSKEHGICCSPRLLFYMRQSGLNISSSKNYIKGKITASFMFLEWFRNFTASIETHSQFDKDFLTFIKKHHYKTIVNFVFRLLSEVGLVESFSIIKELEFPNKAFRNLCIKSQLRRGINKFIHFISFKRLW